MVWELPRFRLRHGNLKRVRHATELRYRAGALIVGKREISPPAPLPVFYAVSVSSTCVEPGR